MRMSHRTVSSLSLNLLHWAVAQPQLHTESPRVPAALVQRPEILL